MITAIVLVDTAVDQIPEAAQAIADIAEVREVYSVTGDTDLVAMVQVSEHEALADVIADRISKVPGVRATRTYISFRAYSSKDLDTAFSLGLDD